MGIVEAIIAAVALITAAGISAGASASASEELRQGQREATQLGQQELQAQERQKQFEYGLGKQSLELQRIGLKEQERQSKRAEARAQRQEKRQNMAAFYAKTNNFLNSALERDSRLSNIWR